MNGPDFLRLPLFSWPDGTQLLPSGGEVEVGVSCFVLVIHNKDQSIDWAQWLPVILAWLRAFRTQPVNVKNGIENALYCPS